MEIYPRNIGADGLTVLDDLAEAVQDDRHWPQFLKTVITVTGAERGAFSALSAKSKGRLWIAEGISDDAVEQWHRYFRYIDPRFAAMNLPERGDYAIYRGEDLVSESEFMASEYYRDFALPHGLRWSRSSWLNPNAPHAAMYGLHLFRGSDSAPFSGEATELLDLIMRRLQIQERIAVANALSRAAGLDDEDASVFLLNSNGSLVMSNERGADLLAGGTVIDNGTSLSFSNHIASAWLSALISDKGLDSHAFGAVARQRETLAGLGSVQFALYPFKHIGSTLSLASVRYALILRGAQGHGAADVARAAHQMYRWTGAELDTVRRLSSGDELPHIAVARACSVETVRSHLKNAKRKAGVKRQVDLVRLMLALDS